MIAAIPATTYSDLSEVSMFLVKLNSIGGKADYRRVRWRTGRRFYRSVARIKTLSQSNLLHRSAGVGDDALELNTLCYQVHWINRNIDSLRIERVDWISGWGFEPVHGEQ